MKKIIVGLISFYSLGFDISIMTFKDFENREVKCSNGIFAFNLEIQEATSIGFDESYYKVKGVTKFGPRILGYQFSGKVVIFKSWYRFGPVFTIESLDIDQSINFELDYNHYVYTNHADEFIGSYNDEATIYKCSFAE